MTYAVIIDESMLDAGARVEVCSEESPLCLRSGWERVWGVYGTAAEAAGALEEAREHARGRLA